MPLTIHSFAWRAIEQYQSTLIKIIKDDPTFHNIEGDLNQVNEVSYTLGHRYLENGTIYLYHDDVLNLFVQLLDKIKFQKIFADKYPIILIDEYQDSYKPIIDRFMKYFIKKGKGPQFGFFGDAWQTIYQSNNVCGEIEEDNNIHVIKKKSNFRSAPKIVDFLNKVRPSLPQTSAIDEFEGDVIVIHCSDYKGTRRKEWYYKDDLPINELQRRVDAIKTKIENETPKDENSKILMISHKILAQQQGYANLHDILRENLRNLEDPFLLFFRNKVEPVYKALCTANTQLLFDTLGINHSPITKKSEKTKWKEFQSELEKARNKRAIDVLDLIYETKLVPMPPNVEEMCRLYNKTPRIEYNDKATLKSFLELNYSEFISAIEFLYPESIFSTEHGVKGEEYDNVVFVISKGWNMYQFETYVPMIKNPTLKTADEQSAFTRNRNLFYVCCSRPRKRLFLFISVPLSDDFKLLLTEFVGKDKIYTFQEFIDNYTF